MLWWKLVKPWFWKASSRALIAPLSSLVLMKLLTILETILTSYSTIVLFFKYVFQKPGRVRQLVQVGWWSILRLLCGPPPGRKWKLNSSPPGRKGKWKIVLPLLEREIGIFVKRKSETFTFPFESESESESESAPPSLFGPSPRKKWKWNSA